MKYTDSLENLKTYIQTHNIYAKGNVYYNESFCNLALSYYGHMGEFTKDDIKYLHDNGCSENDFKEEGENKNEKF